VLMRVAVEEMPGLSAVIGVFMVWSFDSQVLATG